MLMAALRITGICMIVAACLSCALQSADEEKNVPVAEVTFGGVSNLAYFAQKVRQKEPVVIGYIGGSITQGSGASKYALNYYWRSKLALEKEITGAGATVTTYTAAIGGTGSGYACFRAGAQLLYRKPDLLIIEFAVNDANDANASESIECLVRQALRENPRVGIVLFYTASARMIEDNYSKGILPTAVVRHNRVARHYGLAEVLTGSIIAKGVREGDYTLKEFFPDGVHPSDKGHGLYADVLVEALLPSLELSDMLQEPKMPPLLGKGTLEYARLDPVSLIGEPEGWTRKDNQWNWYGVPVWICETPDRPISFVAAGNDIRLIYQGRIRVSWSAGGKEHSRELSGRPNLPMPSSWTFPDEASPNEQVVTVEAIADDSGKVRGEVWGLFSIQVPRAE